MGHKATSMKSFFLFFLNLINICVHAQVEEDIYSYNNVNFDSVVVTINYPDRDEITKYISTYIFENGYNVMYKSYRNDTLIYVSELEYNNEKLIHIQNHSEVYSYNPELAKHIGEIRDDHYSWQEFNYDNGNLINIQFYSAIGNSITNNYEIVYSYNNNNQLVKKSNIDKYVGYRFDFEANTDNIDTAFYKDINKISYNEFEYYTDSILVKYYSDDRLTGYDLISGSVDKPKEIKSYSDSWDLLNHIVYVRNKSGLVTEKFYKLKTSKSQWGGSMDITAENRVIIHYNDKGYPLLLEYFMDDKILMIKRIKYYAP